MFSLFLKDFWRVINPSKKFNKQPAACLSITENHIAQRSSACGGRLHLIDNTCFRNGKYKERECLFVADCSSVLNLSDADTVTESRRYLWAYRVFVGHPNAASNLLAMARTSLWRLY